MSGRTCKLLTNVKINKLRAALKLSPVFSVDATMVTPHFLAPGFRGTRQTFGMAWGLQHAGWPVRGALVSVKGR
jgi:hypothetical protein